MNQFVRRALLLSTAALVLAAVAAAPAQARLTPAAAAISANSTDGSFTITAGVIMRCPTSTFTGTIAADGLSASGTLEFSGRPGVDTCVFTVLGSSSSVDVRCSLRITLRSISSVAGTNASGDIVVDAANPANACSFVLPVHGCSITFGPQTIRNAWTLRQATQTLVLSRVGLAGTGTGGLCGSGGRTIVITASYRVTTPRVTIS